MSIFDDMDDRELLARTIQAEAGGEGPEGMLAAAAVMGNRVRSGEYGGSGFRDVLLAPGQFSAWNGVTGYAGGQGAIDMSSITPSQMAYKIADLTLSGEYHDPTNGATHYYNPAAADPNWGIRSGGDWTKIGNHVFGMADAGRRGPTRATAANRENPLRNWAQEADQYANETTRAIETIAQASPNEGLEKARKDHESRGISLPPGVGMPPMYGGTELTFGNSVPSVRDTFPTVEKLSYGQNNTPAAAAGLTLPPESTGAPGDFAGNPPPPNQVTSTAEGGEAAEEAAEPERMGLFDRIGGWLFPKHEDPGASFVDMLNGIGVGLGQMSTGQTVDLQPFWSNIRASRENAAQLVQDAQEAEYDNYIQGINAETALMNAETAKSRLGLEQAKFQLELAPSEGGHGLSQAMIDKYAAHPVAAPFIEMMTQGDEEARNVGIQGFKEFMLKDAQSNSTNPEAVADLYEAFNSQDPIRVSEVLRENPGMSTEDIKRVADMTDPGQLATNARLIANSDLPQSVKDQMLELARTAGGLDMTDVQKQHFTQGAAYETQLMNGVAGAQALTTHLNTMLADSLELQRNGEFTEGGLTRIISSALGETKRWLPSGWQDKLEEYAGISAEEYQKLDALGQYIVLAAARPMMEGGGSISDGERKTIAMSMPTADQSFEARMDVLNRLTTLNDMDIAAADYYHYNKGGEFHSNFNDARHAITIGAARASHELASSRASWTAWANSDLSEEWANQFSEDMTNEEIFYKLAPKLSMQEFNVYGSLVHDGYWINRDTGQLMQGTKPYTP